MAKSALREIGEKLVAPAKGILAADESSSTIKRRFDAIGVESTEANRRNYREMLFTAKNMSQYISGVILYDETIKQNGASGTPLTKGLKDQNVIIGIKVDGGLKPMPGSAVEQYSEGLDGLPDRLAQYSKLGAQFTKFRVVFTVGAGTPTDRCIEENARTLARYATLSQAAGLVPMVEPEVLMDGSHSVQECQDATKRVLSEVFYRLVRDGADLGGLLLKTNMVLSGSEAKNRAVSREVGERTIQTFLDTVPASVPGILFLSGGQGDDEATVNLNACVNEANKAHAPWQVSFSYGRGLQAAPQKAWRGLEANKEAAQAAFLERSRLTSLARQGKLPR
ncbi:MAG: fructose-bisphosphate aldolase class I [Dehalococcoidia bacterium]|nr:fructose-bisphosphate aldolase class I [Dehalococcoidia bacterium]